MAQLTPLAKGLITVIVLGVAGSLAWNFGLKERFGGGQPSLPKPAASAPEAAAKGKSPPVSRHRKPRTWKTRMRRSAAPPIR
jgi:hypothetical protein